MVKLTKLSKNMKVAIDITAITTARGDFGGKSGVYRYTLNLVKGLIGQKQKNDTIYLVDFIGIEKNDIPEEILKLTSKNKIFFKTFLKPKFFYFKNTKLIKIPIIRWFLKKIDIHILEKIYRHIGWSMYITKINHEFIKQRIDLVHFSDTVYFPTKIKNVLTVHDLVPFIFPEFQKKETIEIHKRRLDFIEKYASGIICVSKNTQKDFQTISKAKISTKVIYEGSDDTLCKINENDFYSVIKKVSNPSLKKTKWKDFYLSYGTIEPRKNYETLVKTYSDLFFKNKINKKLIIIGGNGWGGTYEKLKRFIEENSLEEQIILFGFASDRILNALLNGCYALIYPSLYEGFGLPPLEAMSLGIPTITSNTSSLPEVVGKKGMMFSPLKINELEKLLLNLENKKTWQAQNKYSLKRSRYFSWDKAGKETWHFYREIIK